MAVNENMEECSVPDTDSGCDVDMELFCEDDENPNVDVCKKTQNRPENQDSYYNDARTVKVLLRRLEDEEFFDVWKKNKQLPKSFLRDAPELKPPDDETAQRISSNLLLSVIKSKKNKKRRHAGGKKNKFTKCTICKKKFVSENLMKKHRGSRTCFVFLKCSKCYAKFKTQERLADHIESSCDTQKVFSCTVCSRSYIFKKDLEKHQNPVCRSIRPRLKCEKCSRTFQDQLNLTRHLKAHEVGQKEYLCDICGKLMYRRCHFITHRETHLQSLKHLTCKECGKKFQSKNKLKSHMAIHAERIGREYTCAECGKSFPFLRSLKYHLAVHGMITSLDSFKKPKCNKNFVRRSSSEDRIKIKSTDKEYQCSRCDTSYSTAKNLKNHMLECSADPAIFKVEDDESPRKEKPFVCGVCGKTFSFKHYLKQHCVVHTRDGKQMGTTDTEEEKPHVCNVCGKCFSKEPNLKKHLVVHSKENVSLVCELCKKRFKTDFHIKQHQLMVLCNVSSDDYVCKQCGKEFKTFLYLKMHFVETHNTGAQVTKCNVCEKEFESPRKLKIHSKIHSEGYFDSCKLCGKVLTKRFLKQHRCFVQTPLNFSYNRQTSAKVETVLKVEEQPNLSNQSDTMSISNTVNESQKSKHSSNNPNERNLLPCRFCGRILGSRRSLKRHVATVHRSSGLPESSSNSVVPKLEPVLLPKIEEQSCTPDETCNLNTPTTSAEVTKPRLTGHNERKGAICKFCGKLLSHKNSLKRHMLRVHGYSTSSVNTKSNLPPKFEPPLTIKEEPRSSYQNEPSSHNQSYCNNDELCKPGTADQNLQLPLMVQQLNTPSLASVQDSSVTKDQYKVSVNTNKHLPHHHVSETPKPINSENTELKSAEKSRILMSRLINAQNYKTFLPNTSFINSQCQDNEDQVGNKAHQSIEMPTPNLKTSPTLHNQYPSFTPALQYVNHQVPTSLHPISTSNYQNHLTPTVLNTIPVSSEQYSTNKMEMNLQYTPLVKEEYNNDNLNKVICVSSTPGSIETSVRLDNKFVHLPTQGYQNSQISNSLNSSVQSNYVIQSNGPVFHESKAQIENCTTQTSFPVYYQSPVVPAINFQLIQQNLQPSACTFQQNQYQPPINTQSTTTLNFSNPELTNTYIILQPKLEPNEQIQINSTIPITKPLNQESKTPVDFNVDVQYKGGNPVKKSGVMCNLCKNIFSSKEELNEHLIVHGLAVTPTNYKCTTCGHLFDLKYKYRAEAHLRIHTGEKPFPCNQCSQKFRTSGSLSKHSQSHKPVVPFQCDLCKITLSSAYNVRRHLKTVHKVESPPPSQAPVPAKQEPPAKPILVSELDSLLFGEKPSFSMKTGGSAAPQLNLQSSMHQEIPHCYRESEEPTSNSYPYSFEESNGNHSDIALDLSDMRDEFVPDAMETVLRLENW